MNVPAKKDRRAAHFSFFIFSGHFVVGSLGVPARVDVDRVYPVG